MDEREVEVLMGDVAAVVRSLLSTSMRPVLERIGAVEAAVAEVPARVAAAASEIEGRALTRQDVEALVSAATPPPVDLTGISAEVAALRARFDGMPDPIDAEAMRAVVADELVKAPAADPLVTEGDIRRMVSEAVEELPRPADGRDGVDGESVDLESVQAMVDAAVSSAVAGLPAPRDGRDADPEEMGRMIAAAVAEAMERVPVPKDGVGLAGAMIDRAGQLVVTMSDGSVRELGVVVGRDGDPASSESVAEMVRGEVARAVEHLEALGPSVDPDLLPGLVEKAVAEAMEQIPVPKDGKDVDPEEVREMVAETVRSTVEALPAPQNGKDGRSVTIDDVRPMLEEMVDAIPRPKDGRDGTDGCLPIVKAWTDSVHYAGEVVVRDGSTYQAVRDTGQAPPHEDWICIAAAGLDGADGRSFTVRGTYADGETYSALDVVALNGASFVARRDDPGACPGDGWQIIAMQGKQGKPGRTGDRGAPGNPVTASVVAARISNDGVITLTNADGSEVECDLHPILSKLG